MTREVSPISTQSARPWAPDPLEQGHSCISITTFTSGLFCLFIKCTSNKCLLTQNPHSSNKVSPENIWKEVSSCLRSQPVPDQRALSSGDWHSRERLPGVPACVDLLEHVRWMYCANRLLTARKWPEETGKPSRAVSAVLPPSGSFTRLRGWGWEQTKPGQPSEWGGRAHSGHLSRIAARHPLVHVV